jgi:hypothetical protein
MRVVNVNKQLLACQQVRVLMRFTIYGLSFRMGLRMPNSARNAKSSGALGCCNHKGHSIALRPSHTSAYRPASAFPRLRLFQTNGRIGLVTRTMARVRLTDMVADDDLVCPPPVPACDHPARRLALRPVHAQLSRRRGFTRGARSGCLPRNGATMGLEVRPSIRPRTSQSAPSTDVEVASR